MYHLVCVAPSGAKHVMTRVNNHRLIVNIPRGSAVPQSANAGTQARTHARQSVEKTRKMPRHGKAWGLLWARNSAGRGDRLCKVS